MSGEGKRRASGTPRRAPAASTRDGTQHFFSPCPRGLEPVLHAELERLGAAELMPAEGGIGYAGALDLAYRVNLESRIASRVLWRLAQARYRNEEDVYRAVQALPWHRWFSPERTIRVNVAATASPLRSLDFITLRIKDAVCDRFRLETGRRPSVDTAAPDLRIHAFLDAATLSVYLDTSGEPLFKRGLRTTMGEAPLRENLAAGILDLAGWAPGTPLLDPMCGAGTLLLEAAEMALHRAPGARRGFAFEKLAWFDAAAWAGIRSQTGAAELPPGPLPIFGSDLYGNALRLARENLARAGLEGAVHLKQANALEISAPAPAGVLVANPPYGVRLGEQQALGDLYPKLGDVLKQRFTGWRAGIFTSDLRLPRLIGLKPARRIVLYNGAIECRLYLFELVAGAVRRARREGGA
jgi:putative N6-adenine-specific DNA methylase